ncbi:MAG: hypothetical protein JWN53_1836, partial [Gemmatimonadetes bacterium]|nr:hypothetical protein [Gemmatimonadota bacterium]
RVEAPGLIAGRAAATVLSRTADTLVIGSPSIAPLAVPVARITSLELSRGSSRMEGAKRGLLWGVPIATGLGLLFAPSLRNCSSTCRDASSTEKADMVLAFAFSGAVWGAGIGAIVGRERWEPFDIATRTSVGYDAGAATLQFSLRW